MLFLCQGCYSLSLSLALPDDPYVEPPILASVAAYLPLGTMAIYAVFISCRLQESKSDVLLGHLCIARVWHSV